jgi:hypothetical protein
MHKEKYLKKKNFKYGGYDDIEFHVIDIYYEYKKIKKYEYNVFNKALLLSKIFKKNLKDNRLLVKFILDSISYYCTIYGRSLVIHQLHDNNIQICSIDFTEDLIITFKDFIIDDYNMNRPKIIHLFKIINFLCCLTNITNCILTDIVKFNYKLEIDKYIISTKLYRLLIGKSLDEISIYRKNYEYIYLIETDEYDKKFKFLCYYYNLYKNYKLDKILNELSDLSSILKNDYLESSLIKNYFNSFLFILGFVTNILHTLANKNAYEDTNYISMKTVNINMDTNINIETNEIIYVSNKKQIDIYLLYIYIDNLYNILYKYKEDQENKFSDLMNQKFSSITKDNIKKIHEICTLIDLSNYNLLNLMGYKFIQI